MKTLLIIFTVFALACCRASAGVGDSLAKSNEMMPKHEETWMGGHRIWTADMKDGWVFVVFDYKDKCMFFMGRTSHLITPQQVQVVQESYEQAWQESDSADHEFLSWVTTDGAILMSIKTNEGVMVITNQEGFRWATDTFGTDLKTL